MFNKKKNGKHLSISNLDLWYETICTRKLKHFPTQRTIYSYLILHKITTSKIATSITAATMPPITGPNEYRQHI